MRVLEGVMSQQVDALKTLYLNWVEAFARKPDMPLAEWRDHVEHWGDVTAEPRGVDYTETVAGDVPAMWTSPKGTDLERVILCMPGGGFVTAPMDTHRKLFAPVAKAVGARALILDYRRAPEHPHPAQVEDTVAAYAWLLRRGIKPEHIALAGDSAGGALAISALLVVPDRGLPMPAASMLLSPWIDMELS